MKRTSTSWSSCGGRLLGVLFAAALLCGCGNKGPLYLPDSKPQTRKPAEIVPPPPERPQPSQAVPPPR
ncbi:MAG TPA: lipoprotein [Burkholderiales bacterium]|nr:lipoprotein [Burkholderiales bacterium]